MRVVGTAGHVDHGKSTLVAALTGIHPDRLKEEQAREMTIDLGFAWFTLPDGEDVGVVDVPGHRDFIENMLAGIGGVDAALFVIAADEGVMPQTREHLAILDILQVQGGVVALTKTDLAPDPDWLELVEGDIREVLRGTVLEQAPIVRVSARKGTGLEELKKALMDCLAHSPARLDLGRPRLSIDRVFTIAGFGTVVTGTLLDGVLRLGDEVEILPSGQRGRVRGLQSHKRKEETARPGTRTAVNVSGLDVDQIRRGEVLTLPGKYRASQRLDVYIKLLKEASAPLRHGAEVKFFTGAAEVLARVRLLGKEQLNPGEEGWLQLELRDPVTVVRGDRYILRRPSPGETLGGGAVVDPQPPRRHKRFSEETLLQLETLRQGSPDDVLFQALLAGGALPLREAVQRARLPEEQAVQAVKTLLETRQMIPLEAGEPLPQSDVLVAAFPHWEALTQKALLELEQFHKTYPLRRGMAREELKSRLKLAPRIFNGALGRWVKSGLISEADTLVFRPEHTIQFSPAQQAQAKKLLTRFASAPYTPPSVKECQEETGDEVYAALLDLGELQQVSPEVVFKKETYQKLVDEVKQHLTAEKEITVAQFRDRYQTSRKYALAFLEHLDGIGVTQRDGDKRILRKR